MADTDDEYLRDRLLAAGVDAFVAGGVLVFAIGFFYAINQLLGAVLLGVLSPESYASESAEIEAFATVIGATVVMSAVLAVIKWVTMTVLWVGYYAGVPILVGQTLGKELFDLRAVSADGTAMSLRQSVTRTAVLLVPLPVVIVLAGLLGGIPVINWVFDPLALALIGAWGLVEVVVLVGREDNRRLGDRVANTRVVRT